MTTITKGQMIDATLKVIGLEGITDRGTLLLRVRCMHCKSLKLDTVFTLLARRGCQCQKKISVTG